MASSRQLRIINRIGATMIRKGKYASYDGEEYRFRVLDDNGIKLISNNPSDINNGFTPINQTTFTKVVNISDVDKLFFISSYAKYKGELFTASEEGGTGKVLLDTTDTELAKEMDFERTDKFMYSKMVEWEEVEIIEQKKMFSL
jgi:hypothetical protein